MINLVNRYKQLLASVPKGSFYASDGQVLPFRADSPYELRVTTGVASRQYGVFINDQLITLVTTNGQGIALITTKLSKGRNDIRLVDAITQEITLAYITTRDYATLMAAEAEVLEGIDEGTEQVLLDSRLATSSLGLIELVFGKTVNTGNSFGYDLDTYRELLMELRTAYRYWGGVSDGIARVVRAYTQVSPLIYPAGFGPVWILGKDIISPKTDTADPTYYTLSTLPTVNAGGAGVSVKTIGETVGVGTGTHKYYVAPKRMSWTPPNGAEGPLVPITANGDYTLYGLNYFDPILGVPGPFNIVVNSNDKIALDIDGHGIIDIALTLGGARTAAQISTDINTALVADPRYGVGYSAVAAAYDFYASGSPMVSLTTPNPTTNGYVKLMPRTGADATQTLFNIPIIRGGFSGTHLFGVTSITLSAATDMSSWPSPTVENPLKVVIGGTQFNPTGTPNAAATITAAEVVDVTNVNKGTKTLTLAVGTAFTHNGNEILYVQGEWPYLRTNVQNSREIVVHVNSFTLLPGGPTSDSVVVGGTGAPDTWVVTTNAGGPITPTGFVKHSYFPLDRDMPFDLNANSMVSIPIPDEILKYKGFDANVSFWGRIDDPSRAATQSTINTIGVSFDNQATYNTAAPTVAGLAVNAEWRPQEFIRTVRIPADATRMWIRAKLSAGGVGNFTIHKVRVSVPSAHGGLFLGDGTTPRVEQKIKQGSFLYCWCRDPLNAYEDLSLGLTNTTQVSPGHIDNIAPTEAWLEKFDVTEYDISNNAKNVKGMFTENDWITGVSTNVDLVLRTPPRFSHLVPTLVNETTQEIQFSPTPSYVATLAVKSDQDLLTSILLQDGVPLTQDQWQYNDDSTIELLSTPIGTSVYTFMYRALIRFESPGIDLTTAYTDYVWFADFHVWLRPEIQATLAPVATGIQFDATGVSALVERSTQDQTTSTLIEDTGLSQRIIPASQWSYVDAKTIQIDLSVFNPNGLYGFTYESELNFPNMSALAKVELRSATSLGGLTSATYQEIQHNQVVDQFRFHQMRVTLSNIRNLKDARIQSLLLKGLNMFGTGGTVPILRP